MFKLPCKNDGRGIKTLALILKNQTQIINLNTHAVCTYVYTRAVHTNIYIHACAHIFTHAVNTNIYTHAVYTCLYT